MALWTVCAVCTKPIGNGWGEEGEIRYYGNIKANNIILAQQKVLFFLTEGWAVGNTIMQGHEHTDECGCHVVYAGDV